MRIELEEQRLKVLAAAEVIFSQQGYVSASLREIAESVNMEPVEVYKLFSSKENILHDIALRCAREFKHCVSPIYRSGLHTRAKLVEMIITHVEVVLRNRNAAAIFIHEWRHLSEPHYTEYLKLRDEYEEMFRKVLARGIEESVFREIDEKLGALAILSAANATHQWFRVDRALSVQDVGKSITDILMYGLVRSV